MKQVQNKRPEQVVTTIEHTQIRVENRQLLPASELAEYELVKEGFAERLFLMAEKEQDARQRREMAVIELSGAAITNTRLGLAAGLFSSMMIVGLCAYIAYLGGLKEAAATAIGVITALAAVFVLGRYVGNKNSEEGKQEN